MKTVVVLASLIALVASGVVVEPLRTNTVDTEYVKYQEKVLSLFQQYDQVDKNAEYYRIGMEYDIEANIENYINKTAAQNFYWMYKNQGLLPKHKIFSVFYDEMREEAIALFDIFFYAKDFETFFKTASWARLYINEGQFFYAYYLALIHRPDTTHFVLPAAYELFPNMYANWDAFYRAFYIKNQNGLINPDVAEQYGIVKEQDNYYFYTNYSDYKSYSDDEYKLSYFTEDIGLNSYYFYFHSMLPFWFSGEHYGALKERRGEFYYYFYQQLLARYYLERLPVGLGEIPEFSFYEPIKTAYKPFMFSPLYPYLQRTENYVIPADKYNEDLQFLDMFEKNFLTYLQQGRVKAYNNEIDFHNSKAINFIGNYWERNVNLYENTGYPNYERFYEIIARRLLSGIPEFSDKYEALPSALMFYSSSLRDPVFYQLYSKIVGYFLQYKEYLKPYGKDNLQFVGVKITDVNVDQLVTYFDFFDYDISNAIQKSSEELKSTNEHYNVRQPRLNHKPFTVSIDIKSDIATDAVVKIFVGPKYDSRGYPIKLEDNWMNFVELDWFVYKLTQGQNKIERKSEDFFFYKQDSVSIKTINELLKQGKVPADMAEGMSKMPNRVMLPKGTYGGFPFQFYVFVYPYQAPPQEYVQYKKYLVDAKPFGYPFDRPVQNYANFYEPNMYFEDVQIYHEGEEYPYRYNIPGYKPQDYHTTNNVQH